MITLCVSGAIIFLPAAWLLVRGLCYAAYRADEQMGLQEWQR